MMTGHAKALERRDTVNDAIRAHLRRVIRQHRHPGLHARLDKQRLHLKVEIAHLPQGRIQRRHHRRDGDSVHSAKVKTAQGKQALQQKTKFIGRMRRWRCDAPVRHELRVRTFRTHAVKPKHNIRVADIECQ